MIARGIKCISVLPNAYFFLQVIAAIAAITPIVARTISRSGDGSFGGTAVSLAGVGVAISVKVTLKVSGSGIVDITGIVALAIPVITWSIVPSELYITDWFDMCTTGW